MSNNEFVYRCTMKCPINKKCFVIKSMERISPPLSILYKCTAEKKEIPIMIGEKEKKGES